MRRVALIGLLTVFALPAIAAAESWMDEAALQKAFAGKTIQGLYASGTSFVETYNEGGSIIYTERDVAYQGHWSLQAGTFCTIYNADPKGGCYSVRQVSDNCYEFYFVARTEQEAAVDGPGPPKWTARAAVSDRDATSADKPSV